MTHPQSIDDVRLRQLRELAWNGESQIPVPPQSVIEFSSLARQPDVTVAELSAVVECEPALTTELLRNVNSCVRGLRHKVDCVGQAITMLGIPTSTTILLTSALSNAVEQIESPLIAPSDFRREAVERAIFSRETARRLGLDLTVAYTSAMLQDILLPLLTQYHQVEYHAWMQHTNGESLVEFEREQFGWTHAELSAKTLLKWGLSDTIVLAVLDHHESPEKQLVNEGKLPAAFAARCASLLMDLIHQSPDGVTRLVDLQGILPGFSLMEIAESADVAVKELNSALHHPVSLVHRLQNAMLNQIEQRRKQSVVPGRQFGNYVLEERLKESSMGAIYRARHIRLKRPAAVKVLRADRTNAETIEQFEREVQLTSTLRHPNTVSIFDFGHTPDDLFYYAMELVDGLTLAELVHHDGRLPDGRVISLLKQACGSLAEAHELQLIHHDIKPENIMVSNRVSRPDHVTVLDFGLVASTAETVTSSDKNRAVVGTPLYMSPEAALGRDRVCERSDLYSIAAVGYFLLTGTPVFTGRAVLDVLQSHMRSTPVPPRERCDAEISEDLEDLIMQCLHKDPNCRPASANVLAEKLGKCTPRQLWSKNHAARWWNDHAERAKIAQPSEEGHGIDGLADTLVTTNLGELSASQLGTIPEF